ncbi:UNVERIFIED_CONTAM: hypothetical protein HDU68_004826 [Siphonaria sp. JEL0065]|nr:hypothetical protein HDU68_004826 [Siphonaria sp. JEL0065]
MSERKVLNKYFPPDFDPAKIPRRIMAADQLHTVRLMAPFSMRCNTCGDYVYKGKKFNARKEKVDGETYLGIMIFRFYIRCPKCSAEITFKTDPKNTDYVCEHGAMRNFEPWREETDVTELKKAEKEKEEENNPMKALENRTIASKVEMDILDALDEIRTRNAATERMDVTAVLDRLQGKQRKEVERILKAQEDEDDAVARAVFKSSDDGLTVRRLVDSEDVAAVGSSSGGFVAPLDALDGTRAPVHKVTVSDWIPAASKKRTLESGLGLSIASKKSKSAPSAVVSKPAASPLPESGKGKGNEKVIAISGLAAYGSDSDDSNDD